MSAEAWIQNGSGYFMRVVTIFSMREIMLGYNDILLNVSRSLDPEWFYTDTLGYFMRVRLYGSYFFSMKEIILGYRNV